MIQFNFTFGSTTYVYDWTYVLCLVIGWVTVVLYARRNFDQPTYELSTDEPASIMIPPVIASHGQYARGLMIYLLSMTVLYLGISISGPTVVIPILDLFQPGHNFAEPAAVTPPVTPAPAPALDNAADSAANDTSSVTRETPNPQWPIGVALALIGLAPSIAGLRQPELLLRRFAHRIAAIPAYTKYVAAQMRKTKFDYSRFQDFRYSAIGINYKPAAESVDDLDRRWRKLCILYAQMRKFETSDESADASAAVDLQVQRSIEREVKNFSAVMHDLDARLQAQSGEEDRENLSDEVVDGLRRLYLLISCMLVAYRIQDIPQALQKMGFAPFEPATDFAAPVFATFCILFIILLLQHVVAFIVSTPLPLPRDRMPPANVMLLRTFISDQFLLWCYSAAIVVFSCGSAVYAAISLWTRTDARRAGAAAATKLPAGTNVTGIIPYFYIFLGSYAVAFVSQLLFNLLLRIQQLLNTTFFSGQSITALLSAVMRDAAVSAIAPTGGALLACFWLARRHVQSSGIAGDVIVTAGVMGLLSAFATFLRFNGPGQAASIEMIWSAILFYGLLYVMAGVAVGMLAAMLRSHRELLAVAPGAEAVSV
jgi:hypothetical protein